MKSLREYIDQLDEISRRDFLKGVGATAGAAALGGVSQSAKSQIIGGGENEAKIAATKAGSVFYGLAKESNREAAIYVINTLQPRIIQYYNYGGQQIETVTQTALEIAYRTIYPDFQNVYAQAEKDKEDTSFLGTYMRNRLGNRFGVDAGGRDSQLKMAGSLERFNLMPLAEKFVKKYTEVLQESLNYFKQQTPTKESVTKL